MRATLFSLGVIIGLIETQFHRRVSCVTSVSGGSILNAAMAHTQSLRSYASLEQFAAEPMGSRLANSLALMGVFGLGWKNIRSHLWLLGALAFRAAWALVALVPSVLGVLGDHDVPWWLERLIDVPRFNALVNFLSSVPWPVMALGLLAALALTVFLSRGELQRAAYSSILRRVTGLKAGKLYVRDWGKDASPKTDSEAGVADGQPDPAAIDKAPQVMHVLVATDLLSGKPVFFSDSFVYCEPYGWSPPKDLQTDVALYSSAAFPGVFPPKRLKIKKRGQLSFQNGEMAGTLPDNILLADGGVYNNLGHDWFRIMDERSDDSQQKPVWPFGELDVHPPKVNKYIVVNASAPSRAVRKLGRFLRLLRIMSVLYDNTVLPRVDTIEKEGTPVIDIKESPLALAEKLQKKKGEVGERAEALFKKLNTKSRQFWNDFRDETAGTETKLSPAGLRTGARLMLHGYLSSLVLLHAFFDAKLPDPIKGEGYFLHLVDPEAFPSG